MREHHPLPNANGLKARSRRPCRRSGFSLLELLIVLVILIVCTVLYWGGGSPSGQRKQLLACQQNLDKIYLAMEMYARDYRGRFPVVTNAQTSEAALETLVPRYTSDNSVFICPAGTALPLPPGEPLGGRRISYAYYMGRTPTKVGQDHYALMSDKQVNTESKKAGDNVFSASGRPPGNNHITAGGNFLFTDGHVERVSVAAPFSLTLPPKVVLLNPKP